jgi:hypothetical protein
MKLKEIQEQLKLARKEYNGVIDTLIFDANYSFKKMEEDLRPYTEKVENLSRLYRLQCPITKLTEIPEYGNAMSLDEFIGHCKSGGFIDYDGYGNYCTEDKMTDITILPSDIKAGMYRNDFEKIIWFNR